MTSVDLDRLIQGAELRAADRERRRIRRAQAKARAHVDHLLETVRNDGPDAVTGLALEEYLAEAAAVLDRSTRRNRKATR